MTLAEIKWDISSDGHAFAGGIANGEREESIRTLVRALENDLRIGLKRGQREKMLEVSIVYTEYRPRRPV